MVAGSVLVAAGLALMAMAPPGGVSAYWWLCATAVLTGIGMGTSIPASNNAMLSLADGEVAAIAGLRGMFRQAGGIAAVSVSTAVVARSADPGSALAAVFVVFSVVMVACIPLMFLVTDHRGRLGSAGEARSRHAGTA
jgi:MFS family permease